MLPNNFWKYVGNGTSLITFITIFFSFLQSCFGLYQTYKLPYIDLSIVAICLAIITGVILFLKYKKLRKERNEKPISFKIIYVVYIVFALMSLINLGYALGNKSKASETNIQRKIRIVMMLPFGEQIQYKDGMRQMYGYVEFLKSNNSASTDDFEFVPIDHLMDYKTAKEIIIKEVNRGTKYFISTMSKVNEDLTANFEDILSQCKFMGQKPILICTVTSSPKLVLKPNLVYRFYIRSQEEGKQLAQFANGANFSTATYIVVNDQYGIGALEEFKKYWNGTIAQGIRINYESDVDEIAESIEKNIKNNIPEAKRQVIFIAHYGNGIDNVFKALQKVKLQGIILATSTLSIRNWQEPIKNILLHYEWHTCVPDYKDIQIDMNNDDVIKNFITHTLKKLVQTINLGKKDTISFDERWKAAEVDLNLDINFEKGDAKIPIKVVDKTFFN
ncbi:MAG: ABC transporter substrate-binding protein [Bacteroidota bacterium]|nr:ABC transporter substrate-binding protein [Bacteroidota bacterium]